MPTHTSRAAPGAVVLDLSRNRLATGSAIEPFPCAQQTGG
jgi:hypothetical protein